MTHTILQSKYLVVDSRRTCHSLLSSLDQHFSSDWIVPFAFEHLMLCSYHLIMQLYLQIEPSLLPLSSLLSENVSSFDCTLLQLDDYSCNFDNLIIMPLKSNRINAHEISLFFMIYYATMREMN